MNLNAKFHWADKNWCKVQTGVNFLKEIGASDQGQKHSTGLSGKTVKCSPGILCRHVYNTGRILTWSQVIMTWVVGDLIDESSFTNVQFIYQHACDPRHTLSSMMPTTDRGSCRLCVQSQPPLWCRLCAFCS